MKYLPCALILAFTLAAQAALPPSARDPQYDEFDGLELAEALLRDGKPDEAERVIRDSGAKSDRRVSLLRGDIGLANGDLGSALKHFERARELSRAEEMPAVELRAAEAQFRLKNYGECARAYARAGEATFRAERHVIQKAACEREHERHGEAWATLFKGERALGTYGIFLERVRLMRGLGLTRAALEASIGYLKRPGAKPAQALSLAEISGSETLEFLEAARLRFPGDADLTLTAVPLYFEQGLMSAVASSFERVSWTVKKYAYHAAEVYRQNGNLQKAYWLNMQVPEDKERLRQKFALLVDTGRWDLISSMESEARWAEGGLDDEVHYALGFSLAKYGRLDTAMNHIGQVRSSSMIGKATALAQVLQACMESGWQCRN